MKKLLETIYKKTQGVFCFQSFEDLYYMSLEAMKTDVPLGVRKKSARKSQTLR